MKANDQAKLPRNIEIVRGPAILGIGSCGSSRGSASRRASCQRLRRVSVGAPDTVKGPAIPPSATIERPLRPGTPLADNAGVPGSRGPAIDPKGAVR